MGAEAEFQARLRLARTRGKNRVKRRQGLKSVQEVSASLGSEGETLPESSEGLHDRLQGSEEKISSVWCWYIQIEI